MNRSERQLRALVLPSWYPTERYPIGGVFIQEQARALAASGVAVSVLFLDRVPVREWLRGGKGLWRSREEGVEVYRVRVPRLPGVWPLLYVTWALLMYRKLYRSVRPQVVHAHVALPAGLAGAFIKRLWGTPLVLTEHTGPFSFLMRNRFAALATRFAICSADRVVVVSPALRSQIEVYPALRRPFDVVPNVVNVARFGLRGGVQESGGPPRLLFVGEMRTSIKGVDYLLGAVSALRKRGVEVCLDLVGEGAKRREYEAMARRLHVADVCRFRGTVAHSELAALMRGCDLFVLPSLAETFGVVLVEALACGVPVVATRSGGPESIVTPDLGVLVEPADSFALAAGIEDVLGRRSSFSPGGLRRVAEERYGPGAVAGKLVRLYREVLGEAN